MRRKRSVGLLALLLSHADFAEADEIAHRSRKGVVITFAQKREPSLRMRQPSSSNRPSVAAIISSCSGKPALNFILRIKAGKMPPDDLCRPIALDVLRASVPGDHVSLGVQVKIA